jgi:hypothetical protein
LLEPKPFYIERCRCLLIGKEMAMLLLLLTASLLVFATPI